MRARILMSAALVVALAGLSQAAKLSYRDRLIGKYPFYKTATGAFAPVYPALAKQIVGDYGITTGVCVDLGGGCGSLDLALAKITKLRFYVLDINPWAVRLCNLLAEEAGMPGRICGVQGDAQNTPFRDDLADLVVSRGSIFFWSDQLAGVKEAYRILKPGGVAYIGGGFSRILAPKIRGKLVKNRERQLREKDLRAGWRPAQGDLVGKAKQAGITRVREITEPGGLGWWLEIRK
jgi:SAM-dependent methyltransferase